MFDGDFARRTLGLATVFASVVRSAARQLGAGPPTAIVPPGDDTTLEGVSSRRCAKRLERRGPITTDNDVQGLTQCPSTVGSWMCS